MKDLLAEKTILIIEDNPADAFLCEEILIECGVLSSNIKTISKLSEVEEVSADFNFDVVLLDLFLPDSNGFDTFDNVKSKLEDSVTIIMSGLEDQETVLNTVSEGAQDFILKDDLDAKLLKKTIIYGFERKKNLQLLKESENKYKGLFDLSPLPLILFDQSSLKVKEVNKAAIELYQYSRDAFINLTLLDIFTDESERIQNKLIMGKNSFNCKHITKNGRIIITDSYFNKMSHKQSILLVKDISEQVDFEKKKMNLVNDIQDKERKHFAMELHDGLAQQLVLLSMYLNQIDLNSKNPEIISKCKEISNNAMSQTRILTYNIKPPFLDEGLINGISALFNRLSLVNETSIELAILDNRIKELNFSDEVSYNVFRIIQEFINNSLKYAKANNIFCTINTIEDQVYFELSDNGVGFDLSTVKKGMGINNIAERAKLFTFSCELDSIINKGTRLYFLVDYEK